jgi:hypothetical protein
MFGTEGLKGTLLAACTTALLAPALAIAQDRDTQVVQSYVLTEAGLAKYTQATKKLAAMEDDIPDGCDDDADSKSLDDMVAKLDSVPGAKAAIQSAGMTTREYVVFTWSVGHNGLAAWALSQPGGKLPPGTSKANVDFYKKHEAELQQLQDVAGDGDCDDDDDADEDSE